MHEPPSKVVREGSCGSDDGLDEIGGQRPNMVLEMRRVCTGIK